MKTLIRSCVLASLLITVACNKADEEINPDTSAEELESFEPEFGAKDFEAIEFEAIESENSAKFGRFHFTITKEKAFNPILGVESGKSTLIRGRRGLWARYKAKKLIPGHAYTLWWVVWNKPENCVTENQCNLGDLPNATNVEVELLYASGAVARRNGKATFYGHLRTGDNSGTTNPLIGLPSFGGLQSGNTFDSEVHLVIRSHGPAIPGQVYNQLGSYEGGCTDPLAIPSFTEIPDEIGECADIEFSIHAPVN